MGADSEQALNRLSIEFYLHLADHVLVMLKFFDCL